MNLINKVKLFFRSFGTPRNNPNRADQKHVMTEDELLDQALDESFPASDPPGHISKSAEDRAAH